MGYGRNDGSSYLRIEAHGPQGSTEVVILPTPLAIDVLSACQRWISQKRRYWKSLNVKIRRSSGRSLIN